MILGLELAGQVDFRAGDVAMDIDPAGHHHHARGIYLFCIIRDAIDDPSIFDTDVPGLSIDTIGGIVYLAINDA